VNLAELQRYFASAATSGSGPLTDLDRVFLGSPGLSAEARIGIYNRSYFYRLLDALASVFAQTKRLLGEADFDRLGLAYVAQNPAQHYAVERVGRAFPEYLRDAAAPALVVGLASLEWARLCALVAPNPASVVSVREVDSGRFPRARLSFVPSLQCLELDRRALMAFASTELSSSEQRCGVAVWRSGHSVQHLQLEMAEWRALVCAASGAFVSRVCAEFDSGSAAEDAQRAFRALSSWFAREWLESLNYDDEAPR
jgi:hypothetical protein